MADVPSSHNDAIPNASGSLPKEMAHGDGGGESTLSPQPTCTSLQPVPPDPSPTASTASTELAHERQTLLLMLLGQVCSLHDATPRTFVVHVIALYERGILDANSIRFLFDLGLVPRGYDLGQIIGDDADEDGDTGEGRGDVDRSDSHHGATTGHMSEVCREAGTTASTRNASQSFGNNPGAIVPYCSESERHPWTRYLPPPPLNTSNRGSTQRNEQQKQNNLHSKKMEHRQREASAIRQHLERHESIDNSAHGSILGSINQMQGVTPAHTASSSTSSRGFDTKWKRASSTATQNSLTSADESFNNPSFRPRQNANIPDKSNQIITHMPPAASWSVEHHPLSLSRYQRDFHQLSLLATGSFGSVYHAIHKLEQRPYAVKCVTFSAAGYYAETLALVIREVRCLAQLDHPNCVRYYTSWLEPSWMTGDRKEALASDDSERGDGEFSAPQFGGKGNAKLLPDIERVIEGLHNGEELDNSVDELEAILYGGDGGDVDDGFNWASSSQAAGSAFSFSGAEQKEAADEWDNLPSHRTNNYPMMQTYSEAGDGGGESDESEWTQDLNDRGGSSDDDESYHNSQAHGFERQGSLDLVPAGGANKGNQRRRPYKKQHSSSSATYKYQISLYIQMQLCNPTTLADWIKQRNNNCNVFDAEERQARARPAFEVFRQIVNGLEHVHAKGIIHRDLKPANIFVGDDGSFMIGDYGLSKMMQDATLVDIDAIILPSGVSNGAHTVGVGTASYASPEQIASKTYGTAADIFSLGLVLLELFSNFTSAHERAKAFHDCRHDRELASWMKECYPELSALILACTHPDWRRRPSASDIQAAAVFQETATEILRAELRSLKVEMTRKDQLIERQEEQMQEKDRIIEHLRQRLAELEAAPGLDKDGSIDAVGRDPIDIEESSCSASDSYQKAVPVLGLPFGKSDG